MHPGTLFDTDTNLGVDLDAVITCEVRPGHEAAWHLFGVCPDCGISRHVLACTACRDALLGSTPVRCGEYSGPGKKFYTRSIRL